MDNPFSNIVPQENQSYSQQMANTDRYILTNPFANLPKELTPQQKLDQLNTLIELSKNTSNTNSATNRIVRETAGFANQQLSQSASGLQFSIGQAVQKLQNPQNNPVNTTSFTQNLSNTPVSSNINTGPENLINPNITNSNPDKISLLSPPQTLNKLDNDSYVKMIQNKIAADSPTAKAMAQFSTPDNPIPQNLNEYLSSSLKDTVQSHLLGERDVLVSQAQPLYDVAYNQNLSSNNINKLLSDPVISAAYNVVKTTNSSINPNSIGMFDEIKSQLVNHFINGVAADVPNSDALIKSINTIQNTLDSASPHYAKARSLYEEGVTELNQLHTDYGQIATSSLGDLSNLRPAIFNPNMTDPNTFKTIRNHMLNDDPATWYGLVQQQGLDVLQQARAEAKNQNINFYKPMFGQGSLIPKALEGDPDIANNLSHLTKIMSDLSKRTLAKGNTGISLGTIASGMVAGKYDNELMDAVMNPSLTPTFSALNKASPQRYLMGVTDILAKNYNISEAKHFMKSVS